MAVGFCPNLQEQLAPQDETYDARGSLDTQTETRRCDELIFQLCDWIIPRKSVQVTNDGHQQTHVNIFVSIDGSCSDEEDTLHTYQRSGSNLVELRRSRTQDPCVERTSGSSSAKSGKSYATAIHSGRNGVTLTQVLQTGDVIHSNCMNEHEISIGSGNESIGDSRIPKLGQTVFTSLIGFGSTPSCCRHEQREKTRTCAVEGASFCLGSLSMMNHCAQFGGGPGMDRDGAQGSGKFCGVGARYRVGKISPSDRKLTCKTSSSPSDDLIEARKNLKPADSIEALNPGSSRLFTNPEISAKFVLEKLRLFAGISKRLREMVGALNNVRLFVLPRVPDLEMKVLSTMNEFIGYAVQFLNSGSLNDNVINYKRSMAGVILNFDPKEFLSILYVPDEEVSASLLKTLKEWNEVLRTFLEFYVDGPNCRAHEEK